MDNIDLAYIAGVMDSDGYITIKCSTYNIRKTKDSKNPVFYERVGIKQVQPEAIKFIYDNFGGYYHIEKPSTKNGKPLYSLQLTNLKAFNFIKAIYPFLRIKIKQADIIFKLRECINKGKTQKTKSIQKDRWNNLTEFNRYSVAQEDIETKKKLYFEIKALNDSHYKFYIPKF